jgi:hypothetical protein
VGEPESLLPPAGREFKVLKELGGVGPPGGIGPVGVPSRWVPFFFPKRNAMAYDYSSRVVVASAGSVPNRGCRTRREIGRGFGRAAAAREPLLGMRN